MIDKGAKLRAVLAGEARRLYVDCSYSSRGHYEEAAHYVKLSRIVGLPLAIIGGLTAVTAAFTALLVDARWITALLAILSAILTGLHGFLRPEENAEAHGTKAGRYKAIRDDALLYFKIEIYTSASDQEVVGRLKAMRNEYKELGLVKPHRVSQEAYERAKASIEKGEASYENDPLWKQLEDH